MHRFRFKLLPKSASTSLKNRQNSVALNRSLTEHRGRFTHLLAPCRLPSEIITMIDRSNKCILQTSRYINGQDVQDKATVFYEITDNQVSVRSYLTGDYD